MNNKGFAITTILYGTLILFLMLMVSMLGILNTYKDRLEILIESNNGARDIINSVYEDSYVYNADSLLVTLSGRKFYKANDGLVLVGYVYAGGYTGPVLVGTTADSVAYYTTYDSNTILTYAGTIEYNGNTYYYSSGTYWMSGDIADTSELNRVKYVISASDTLEGVEMAALQLLQDKLLLVKSVFV